MEAIKIRFFRMNKRNLQQFQPTIPYSSVFKKEVERKNIKDNVVKVYGTKIWGELKNESTFLENGQERKYNKFWSIWSTGPDDPKTLFAYLDSQGIAYDPQPDRSALWQMLAPVILVILLVVFFWYFL